MICLEKENNIRTSGVALTKEMGIKKEGMGFIQNILRSQIYSDKISAVLREVCVNGIDSHVEAGRSDRAIQVTLPSRFNATLKIRDFGVGMSEETILDIYSFYGSSTKRNTNLQSGFMGIGKVSPLSYGDSFVVASFFNGIKNTYNVYVDTNNLSQIAKLNSELTDEETGVEISMSVKDSDVEAFHDKANAMFGHFKVPPIVNGIVFSKTNKESLIEGKDWVIYNSNHESVAIMGNVAYPISDEFGDSKISNLLNCGVEIEFEIGSISVSASRESLEYNDSTKKAVAAKLNLILVELLAGLNAKFDSCKGLFEAKTLYSCMEYGGRLHSLSNLVKNGISFRGAKIESSNMDVRLMNFTEEQLSVARYVANRYSSKRRVSKNNTNYIDCGLNVVIVDNDSSCLRSKIHDLIMSGKRVYVTNFVDDKQRELFLEKTGVESPTFVKLSTLTKTTSVQTGGNATRISNSKHSTGVFSYDFRKSALGNYRAKRSDFWTVESIDLKKDSGIYVEINEFFYKGKDGTEFHPSLLNTDLERLKSLGVSVPKVYGFKKGYMAAVNKNTNMVCLWKFINLSINEFFKKKNLSQKVANYLAYHRYSKPESSLDAITNMTCASQTETSLVSKKTVFSKNKDVIHYMKNEKDGKLLRLAQSENHYFTLVEKPEHDLEKLKNELRATYPMLQFVPWYEKKAHGPSIDYVNLTDG